MAWKKILVPHDFSSSANHAAAIARDEAKLHGATLVLLHVIDLPTAVKPDTVIVPDDTGAPVNIRDYAVTAADAHLTDIVARLAKDGVEATPYVRIGNPVEEILKFVDEERPDVIVMGTHGRTGFQRMLVGSVTERIVRGSAVPVVTVRHPS